MKENEKRAMGRMASTLCDIYSGLDDKKYDDARQYLLMADQVGMKSFGEFENGAFEYLYNKCKQAKFNCDMYSHCFMFVGEASMGAIRDVLYDTTEGIINAVKANDDEEVKLLRLIQTNLIKAICY